MPPLQCLPQYVRGMLYELDSQDAIFLQSIAHTQQYLISVTYNTYYEVQLCDEE